MKLRTTKDLLKDLVKLDITKDTYVVSSEWTYVATKEKCTICDGKGSFKKGTQIYSCLDCNGTGKKGEKKSIYVVKRCAWANNYPQIELNYNEIQMSLFDDIQGFFNNKDEAQELADKLNKGR